jgi:hypothetical protein
LSSRSSAERILGAIGLLGPSVAVGLVVTAGFLTPGYDPMRRTVSRLAVSGQPAASVAELGICLVGFAAIALAIALGPGSYGGRSLLAIAGGGLLLVAVWRLDPGSSSARVEHWSATGIAMAGLAGAPLAFGRTLRRIGAEAYGRISLAFGAGEVGLLLVGLALLPTTFAAWGLWERCLLTLPIVWMLAMSWRVVRTNRIKVSTDDTVNAAAASQRSRDE